MVWWDREDMERRMEEGMRSNMEMAYAADEAIMRLLASGEHDEATYALRQVVGIHRAESADPLAVLETLAQTEAVSKRRSLHEQLVDLAEVLQTGLPGDTLRRRLDPCRVVRRGLLLRRGGRLCVAVP